MLKSYTYTQEDGPSIISGRDHLFFLREFLQEDLKKTFFDIGERYKYNVEM
jgi:hypothetical protein